ncbi:SCO family protein [Sphingopyxis sp. XHP0097]|uniref:SCO family protein n=1 Tax=Sphingopyxis jiangsuensis TaxID=2871171 RepID=A0ABS7MF25_9SPHN|nr:MULTISPECIES: SCO family protein [Sphingopyxis]MBY4637473.1 SCO family protein [Sphingopyxis jiangsuensis]
MMNFANMGQRLVRASLMLVLASALASCGGPAEAPPARPPLEGARIGGPFTLVDQDGNSVSDTDFAGKYRLLYFGYSFCPDICPIDLQKLMRGLTQFEKAAPERGAKIQPLFVTVDPARDTPEALKPFVARYHPRLLGLTGTPEQIAAAAKAFVVTYNKVEGSAPDRYLMAHSQLAFLMDPEGKPLALLPLDDPSTDADEGTPDAVAAELEKWVK